MIITNKNIKLGLKSFKLSLPMLYQELHSFTLARRILAKHYNYGLSSKLALIEKISLILTLVL